MSSKKWIERGKDVLMNTYAQLPIVFEEGDGVYLKDINGNKYLDFVAGIAVSSLGYKNKSFIEKMNKQMNKLLHCSNLYYNIPQIEVAEVLTKHTNLSKVFFCNSGTEAVEAALKLSRLYAKKYKSESCYEIISMENSFHGRTYGSISVTGQKKYQKGLEPLLPGVKYVPFNNIEALIETISNNTCAIIIEPIQGEGGINPAEVKYLKKVRNLCDQNNILLIFDEVQSGIGRTGELFAFQHYNVQPDIVTSAKGLGNGIPIGAIIANEKASKAFEPGNHASTFGGNPFACTAAKIVLNELYNDGLLKKVKEQGKYLKEKLEKLSTEDSVIKEIRGMGLMLGMTLDIPTGKIINQCLEKGLLLVGAGTNTIRFVPPLIITKEEIDSAIEIIEEVLEGV